MREMGLSRNTVRKAIRAESAQFSYRRAARPRLRIPIESGQGFRREVGHHSGLKSATSPI